MESTIITKLNPIYKKALEKCTENISLIPLIEALPEYMHENAVLYLIGELNPNEVLPKTSSIKENATLISYNWLTGMVEYSYISNYVRYFKTEEEAIEFSNRGDFRYSTSSIVETPEYSFIGTYINADASDCCTKERWIECQ